MIVCDWDDPETAAEMRRALVGSRCHDWAPRDAKGYQHCTLCPARCTRGRDGKISLYEAFNGHGQRDVG